MRGFAESGGSAGLSAPRLSNSVITSTLGVCTQSHFELSGASGVLHGMVGWRHAAGDTAPVRRMAFDGGRAFTVAGAPLIKDALQLELGAEVALTRNATMGLSYAGEYGNGSRENSGNLSLRWAF